MNRFIIAILLVLTAHTGHGADAVTVGSKNFTESYLLAEIAAQLLESRGYRVDRKPGLGGTKICYDALNRGEIDIYPEYTGTIRSAILNAGPEADLDTELKQIGLQTYSPPGFNNTYVLAIRETVAQSGNLTSISDLRRADRLRVAVSHEFRARNDGWNALAAHYGLSLPVRSIEHGLAYKALTDSSIDITDAYSTDGELARANLTLLNDDLGFFPRYDAVWLGRDNLPDDVAAVLALLEGRIDERRMQSLNARVVMDKQPIASVAASFLRETGLVEDAGADTAASPIIDELIRNTLRHIQLTLVALIAASTIGVMLAMVVQPLPRASSALLYICSLIQTIPSIALLALMIPLFGIGWIPAVIALFLYALLPVVRATLTAFNAIEPDHLTVATALGMTNSERRRHVLVPLAMPHIIAGLRVAAVISIGTATLAAFIGAGGLGQPIVTGLALNDTNLILQGALPAAALAVVTDLLFDLAERRLVPAHLRQNR
ncbi:MAG: glycine betaine ABC transporter substrate-binding protein [Pseudomonadota bacterium]